MEMEMEMSASTSKTTSRGKNIDLDLGDIIRPKILKRDDNGYDGVVLEEDSTSRVPNALLGEIISLLPSKDAFVTSVLSRRWMRVFTWVTRLDFDDSPICHCLRTPHMIDSVPDFKIFVDNVLQLCQSSSITRYRLHFGKHYRKPFVWTCDEVDEGCYPDMEPMHLKAWICFLLSRHVKELDICVHVRKPGKLPLEIFGCQTLEVLKIDVNLCLEVPVSLCLPILKEFHLTLPLIPDGDFVTRIVSSCPYLQSLSVRGHWNSVNPIDISSPSLRRLKLFATNLDDESSPRTKVVLDVPNLEYLSYLDLFALHYSIEPMNALVEAEVDIVDCVMETIVSFVQLMPNVRLFFMRGCCLETLHHHCEPKLKLPVFQNLNHLQLGCYYSCDWNKVLMMELLNCTPFLETLDFLEGISPTVNCDDDFAEQECKSWSCTQTIPTCLAAHLKRITIKGCVYLDWEIEIIKYFLRHSLVLEKLELHTHLTRGLNKEVQMLPRASNCCSIRVIACESRIV